MERAAAAPLQLLATQAELLLVVEAGLPLSQVVVFLSQPAPPRLPTAVAARLPQVVAARLSQQADLGAAEPQPPRPVVLHSQQEEEVVAAELKLSPRLRGSF